MESQTTSAFLLVHKNMVLIVLDMVLKHSVDSMILGDVYYDVLNKIQVLFSHGSNLRLEL